ncbi:MAG TPA: serine/threonine-protein kinase, partial [Gemmataceae bacterium]
VQAAEALEHAHQAGVVHRDVKPANLMVDARGNLWVTDFGLAVCQSDTGVTRSGDLIGTLRYMSPEQALGRRRALDHRTDVYSLGATLYELLTLLPAFGGDDRQELLRRIVSEEPRPACRVNPVVPADLETVVAKAMAKAPDERYATARELAEDLQRFLEDRPIRARRPSLWQKGRKWARRNEPVVWGLALFTALAPLASLLGTVVYAFKAKEQERERRETESKLYRALLNEANSLRVARVPGYRTKVWDNLREAARLEVPKKNLDRIRDEALACLGDPVGLAWVKFPSVARAERPRVSARWDKAVRDEYKEWGLPAPFPAQYPRAVSADGEVLAFSIISSLVHLRPRDRTWHYQIFTGLGGVYDLAFTSDRKSLIAGCEEGIVVWDVSHLPVTVRWSARSGNVLSVAAQPGGRLLAAGTRRLELWSLDSNRLVASLEPPEYGVKAEFSADGKWLLAVKGDRALAAWPLNDTPERRLLSAGQGGVPAVAFSPDGKRLASGSKAGAALIWDVASGRLLHTCRASPVQRAHFGTVESVAFSPDGRLLAAGDFPGVVRLWDVETGK